MKTSVAKMDWAISLVTRGGELKGALRQMFMITILERGPPFSEHTSEGFRVGGAFSYEAGYAVAQLGMSVPGAVVQLRVSLWNLKIGICNMIFEWGFPSKHEQLAIAQSGMNFSNGSCPIGDEPL